MFYLVRYLWVQAVRFLSSSKLSLLISWRKQKAINDAYLEFEKMHSTYLNVGNIGLDSLAQSFFTSILCNPEFCHQQNAIISSNNSVSNFHHPYTTQNYRKSYTRTCLNVDTEELNTLNFLEYEMLQKLWKEIMLDGKPELMVWTWDKQ